MTDHLTTLRELAERIEEGIGRTVPSGLYVLTTMDTTVAIRAVLAENAAMLETIYTERRDTAAVIDRLTRERDEARAEAQKWEEAYDARREMTEADRGR